MGKEVRAHHGLRQTQAEESSSVLSSVDLLFLLVAAQDDGNWRRLLCSSRRRRWSNRNHATIPVIHTKASLFGKQIRGPSTTMAHPSDHGPRRKFPWYERGEADMMKKVMKMRALTRYDRSSRYLCKMCVLEHFREHPNRGFSVSREKVSTPVTRFDSIMMSEDTVLCSTSRTSGTCSMRNVRNPFFAVNLCVQAFPFPVVARSVLLYSLHDDTETEQESNNRFRFLFS